MNWSFRSATAQDWTAVAELLTTAELPLDGAQQHLSHFVLAFEDSQLAGVAGIERYGSNGLLRSVAVKSRGKGLGKALTQYMIDHARQSGLTHLILLTTTAEDFFTRFGFTRILRSAVPQPVTASEEFQGACPDTATVMQLAI